MGKPQTSPVRISTTTLPQLILPSGLRRETLPCSIQYGYGEPPCARTDGGCATGRNTAMASKITIATSKSLIIQSNLMGPRSSALWKTADPLGPSKLFAGTVVRFGGEVNPRLLAGQRTASLSTNLPRYRARPVRIGFGCVDGIRALGKRREAPDIAGAHLDHHFALYLARAVGPAWCSHICGYPSWCTRSFSAHSARSLQRLQTRRVVRNCLSVISGLR